MSYKSNYINNEYILPLLLFFHMNLFPSISHYHFREGMILLEKLSSDFPTPNTQAWAFQGVGRSVEIPFDAAHSVSPCLVLLLLGNLQDLITKKKRK
jgi:hypothetical protein